MVDVSTEVNRELVMQLVTDIASGNRFYSDLNGFQVSAVLSVPVPADVIVLLFITSISIIDWSQMQQRRTLAKLPLQANFYPMSSSSFLQDSASRLSLLSAQSQAVASLRPGEQGCCRPGLLGFYVRWFQDFFL